MNAPATAARAPASFALDLPAYAVAGVTLAGFLGRWHWLLDLTSHFRWYWLVAAVAWLAVAAWRRSRPARWCLVLAATANAVAMLPFWLPPAADSGAGGDPLEIVSLNVFADNEQQDRVLAYLRERDADVVVLIEVDAAWAQAFEALAALYPHRVVEPRDDKFGIAVLSRLPLESPRVERVAAGPPVILATLPRGGRGCLLVAAHPQAPITADWSARRDAQLAAIGDIAAMESRPVIVAGDLNATPWSHGFRQLIRLRGLRDSAQGRGVQPTWNARYWAPRIPIDHVVVSPEVQVISRTIGPDVGSDHLPVEATLLVP
ncbi:MAG: endonuclease/exonuclease/phosphatase family protein [Planctomycetota bacterium]